jgi:signal transduction histidine kinase
MPNHAHAPWVTVGSASTRFWQADDADRLRIGLALSIARGTIEAHGRRLWVTSRMGEGSIFSFTLPAA